MANVEQFFKEHSDRFDSLEPKVAAWAAIEEKLDKEHRKGNSRAWIGIAATVVVLIGLSLFFGLRSQYGLDVDDRFPNVVLETPEGEAMPLSEVDGKVVLVEFWASWSMVCTEEHCYYFQPLYEQYKEKGFEIYGISFDHSEEEWKSTIERDGLEWTNVSDLKGLASPLAQKYEVKKLPATFLLDENGKVLARDLDAGELENTLAALLANE